ncbi:uncharacterized protein LOC126892445 [Diabrotica virgifera virgifera]|uniref:Tyr recombinase domain-containing protein n=1 Tax=Diabrotica virgifera virgifera TaxID=50390 RepID=A0ABM5L670_DIAVI|nr:uncharacterized protein LOC126892445 [Diabrotica virgifera virgifera]
MIKSRKPRILSYFAFLLKVRNVGYRPKKASIFTREQFEKFLMEAPDEEFLVHKVAMILGISGACRREELYNITMNDIQQTDGLMIVKVPNTKTNIQRTFTVVNKPDDKIPYLEILQKYIKLRPLQVKSNHLFVRYAKGKCCAQVIGKGTIGGWPSQIAKFLNLPNPENYTGHLFRSTSATLLANKGVDVLGLKRHGGWRSSTVAESYVEDSLQNKIDFAEKILCNTSNITNVCDSAGVSVRSETTAQTSGISLNN